MDIVKQRYLTRDGVALAWLRSTLGHCTACLIINKIGEVRDIHISGHSSVGLAIGAENTQAAVPLYTFVAVLLLLLSSADSPFQLPLLPTLAFCRFFCSALVYILLTLYAITLRLVGVAHPLGWPLYPSRPQCLGRIVRYLQLGHLPYTTFESLSCSKAPKTLFCLWSQLGVQQMAWYIEQN